MSSSKPSSTPTGSPALSPPSPITCPECGDPVVEINLLIDGQAITMRSCAECDTRSWHRDGQEIELGGVLADLSSTPTRYRRDLATR